MTELIFPTVVSPVVTVVMVTHGAREIVAQSLEALLTHSPPIYRLVIVDSASPDDTPAWIEEHVRGVDLLRSDTNIGYGAGSNLGAERAASPQLLFMNPDIFPTPGWLPPLMDAFRSPLVAAAGPRLIHPDGRLQAAGSLVDRDGRTRRYGDGDSRPDSAAYGYPRSPDYLSGACLVVNRRDFMAVGGFDPMYGIGYYEDVDLCFDLAARGRRTMFVPASSVIHVRDASGGSRSLAHVVARNQQLFCTRWRETLASRPTSAIFERPESRLASRDIRASRRILVMGLAAKHAEDLFELDPCAHVTVVGCAAPAAEPLAEWVPDAPNWHTWFHERRNHYDVVIGRDDRFNAFADETQCFSRRFDDLNTEALAAVARIGP